MIHDLVQVHYAAFFSLAPSFARMARRCFLSFMTLKRSKSERPPRTCFAASFFAHAVASHFFTISSASSRFLSAPLPMARGTFVTTIGVRTMRRYETACRLTPVVGPSTRAYNVSSVRKEGRRNGISESTVDNLQLKLIS